METPKNARTELLRQIKEEVVHLLDSPLVLERKKNRVFPVIGEGNHNAGIMFIGEAPGKNEAATGRPFCGAAGKVLDDLLQSAGIERKDVYITNIVKDRPPLNRDPSPDEIALYAPFLERQINIIQPSVIVTLGRFSMRYIMEKFGLSEYQEGISRIHGKVFPAKAEYGNITIVPLLHPAVATYNADTKSLLTKDIQVLASLSLPKK
ncbi:MAG: uracil-DNA glycosylase [Candidatus Yanofskybacteria bacterium]|nr:uracil-DNA glycosylase [Candidatus Yanofskybacteria bacterium]